MREVEIRSDLCSSRRLQSMLSDCPLEDVTLELRERAANVRGPDVAVLVAIVGASGTAIGALLTGFLKVVEQRKGRHIVLVGKTGRRLEIPADTPPERIQELVQQVKDLDLESVHLR